MNARAGQVIGNEVIAKVGVDGLVELYHHNGSIDVIFDVVGYFPE